MYTTEGKIFKMKPTAEVIDHIRSNEYNTVEASPRKLSLVKDNGRLFLCGDKTNTFQYPIRTSFLRKLLKWHSLPEDIGEKVSEDLFLKFLNEILQNIRSKSINIKIENNEVLTITSQLYSEITDLEIFDLIKPLNITRISRNDFMTRFYTEKKDEADPIEGDYCGFGMDIINSETGFAALSVNHFILRYVCKNGATAPINIFEAKRNHYNQNNDALERFLNKQIELAPSSRKRLIELIKVSKDKKAKRDQNRLTSRLSYLIGRWPSKEFFSDFNWEESKYDLFNHVTHKAKTFEITKRYQLERLAGEIIQN